METTTQSLYNPSQIRTQNMVPDRSTDVYFDSETAPSLTQQQFQRECDINVIVKNNEATGLITHVNNRTPQWGDMGDAVDYQTALNQVRSANEAFMALPAEVRARFLNDPAQLLAFVSNPANAEEAIKLGLATVPTPSAPSEEKPLETPATEA